MRQDVIYQDVSHHPSHSDLGVFLRSRRERLAPAQAGMPSGPGARRTPGLRREEVACLAGVSVDYYARLERGRERNPSPAVLESLTTVLGLTPDECRYLYTLAGQAAAGPADLPPRGQHSVATEPEPVRRSVLTVLESMRPSPAFVTNRTVDMLAANPAGLALFPGVRRHPPVSCTPEHGLANVSRYLFTDPEARIVVQDWEVEAAGHAAHLRSQLGENPDAPDLLHHIESLLADSPDFARLWEGYHVQRRTGGTRHFQHPIAGDLRLDYESLPLADAPGYRLILYPTAPGTPARDAVTLIDSRIRANGATQAT